MNALGVGAPDDGLGRGQLTTDSLSGVLGRSRRSRSVSTTRRSERLSSMEKKRVDQAKIVGEIRQIGSAKRNKREKASYKKDKGYQHSLCDKSPSILIYLAKVPDGIKAAAIKSSVKIHSKDLEWLSLHLGRCEQYEPPHCEVAAANLKRFVAMEKTEQDLDKHYESALHKIRKPSPRFPYIQKHNTQANYERQIKAMWNFMAIIGCYEQMILLLAHTTVHNRGPSVSPKTVYWYLFHRFLEFKTPLLADVSSSTGLSVVDIFGKPVLCEGSVKNMNWFDTALAAIKALHVRNGRTNVFHYACEACIAKNRSPNPIVRSTDPNRSLQPCDPCGSQVNMGVRLFSGGDPTMHLEVKHAKKVLQNISAERDYLPDSKSPFLPSDLYWMHKHMQNRAFPIADLMMWVFTLLSNRVASRVSYTSGISVKNNFTNSRTLAHWDMSERHIQSIGCRIREKTDKKYFYYLFRFDDFIKTRCLLRHLFVYIHCTQMGNGFLFPDPVEISNRHFQVKNGLWEGKPHDTKQSVCYDDVHKFVASSTVKCRYNFLANFGNHSFRATCYLLSILGGAQEERARAVARHLSLIVAGGYVRDSHQVRGCLQRANIPPEQQQENLYSPFDDPLVSSHDNTYIRQQKILSKGQNKSVELSAHPLLRVSKVFVEEMLCVTKGDSRYHDPAALLELSYTMSFTKEQPAALRVTQLLKAVKDPHLQEALSFAVCQDKRDLEDRIRKELSVASPCAPPSPIFDSPSVLPALASPGPTGAFPMPIGILGTAVTPPPMAGSAIPPSLFRSYLCCANPGSSSKALFDISQFRRDIIVADGTIAKAKLLDQVVKEIVSKLPSQFGRTPSMVLHLQASRDSISFQGIAETTNTKKAKNDFFTKILNPFSVCFYSSHCNADPARFASFQDDGNVTFQYSNFKSSNACYICNPNGRQERMVKEQKKRTQKNLANAEKSKKKKVEADVEF